MRLSMKPDPWMAWIYEPEHRDDPVARDLRERRAAAIRSAPRWMIEIAMMNDEAEAPPAA